MPAIHAPLRLVVDNTRPARPRHRTPPLMPCAFCGEKEFIGVEPPPRADAPADEVYYVECGECGCQGPGGMTPLEAAEAWNTRPAWCPSA